MREKVFEIVSTVQRSRVLRVCTVPRAEVMFVTIQRENIRLSKKEMNMTVTTFILPDVCS
jgi:hypothetical protein